jgi:plastocyanin
MDSKIAVAVGLASVIAAVLAPISTLAPAFAATIAVDLTPGSSSKTNDAFSPNPVQAKVGDTVTWTNKDTTAHTITSGTGANDPDKGKAFDSSPNFNPLITPQATFSHTFEEAGEFPYFCALHPNMVGKVVVATAGGSGNGGTPPQTTKVTATLDGKSYEITVKSATSKATSATIKAKESVTVVFDKAGEVELTLPKDMISSINSVKAGNQELLNGQPTANADGSSTIKFTVPEGSTSVVIKGATVVPEFPVIAAILAVSIAALIGYTRFARNGTGFFGRA